MRKPGRACFIYRQSLAQPAFAVLNGGESVVSALLQLGRFQWRAVHVKLAAAQRRQAAHS